MSFVCTTSTWNIPEEILSDDASLDIGSERQARFAKSVPVYMHDGDKDRSVDVKHTIFHHQELK